MLRVVSFFILVSVVQPTITNSQSYDSSFGDIYFIEKNELTCLYKRIDEFLEKDEDESENSIKAIFLPELCSSTSITNEKRTVIRGPYSYPDFEKPENEDGISLTADDVLFLSYKHLQCIQRNYIELMDEPGDKLRLDFEKICGQDGNLNYES